MKRDIREHFYSFWCSVLILVIILRILKSQGEITRQLIIQYQIQEKKKPENRLHIKLNVLFLVELKYNDYLVYLYVKLCICDRWIINFGCVFVDVVIKDKICKYNS